MRAHPYGFIKAGNWANKSNKEALDGWLGIPSHPRLAKATPFTGAHNTRPLLTMAPHHSSPHHGTKSSIPFPP
eukprot:1158127-Pelagomonas_calceolata.AAC.2